MPYQPEHKRETRQRILRSAARLFNRKGFTDVTIAEIMARCRSDHGGSIVPVLARAVDDGALADELRSGVRTHALASAGWADGV